MKFVIASGGFDPIHIGHIHYLREAKKLGDYLLVIVNNDNWLMKKKGGFFMPFNQRAAIVHELKSVNQVLESGHKKNTQDMSVCEDIQFIKDVILEDRNWEVIFAKGGDRTKGNVPEADLCKQLKIRVVYNVGGGKVESSSRLVQKAKKHKINAIPVKKSQKTHIKSRKKRL